MSTAARQPGTLYKRLLLYGAPTPIMGMPHHPGCASANSPRVADALVSGASFDDKQALAQLLVRDQEQLEGQQNKAEEDGAHVQSSMATAVSSTECLQ